MFPHETGSGTSSGANSPAHGGGSSSSLRTRTLIAGASGRPATYGSRTLILDPTETNEEDDQDDDEEDDRHVVGVLHVEGATRPQRRIQWAEEVVDNEHLGKKKSKICCIFKKSREFGESSDESSSSDSSSDEGSSDSGSGGPNLDRGPSRHASRKTHDHSDEEDCAHHHHHHHQHGHIKKKKKPVLNSYERMPKAKSFVPAPINQPSQDTPPPENKDL